MSDDLTAQCGASTRGVLADGRYLGPCVLRAGHDGPVHQDADGARWAGGVGTPTDLQASPTAWSNALREQLAEALHTEQWGSTAPWARHGGGKDWPGHNYDGGCGICRGDVGAIIDVVMAVVQPELDRLREYENALAWETSCTGCARTLDGAIAERDRADQYRRLLADASTHLRTACHAGRHDTWGAGHTCAACQLTEQIDTALNPEETP